MTAAEWCRLFKWAETAQAMAADEQTTALAEHGNQEGEVNSRNSADNGNSVRCGDRAEYIVRHLKRDAPQIAERLARGSAGAPGRWESRRVPPWAAGAAPLAPLAPAALPAWSRASPVPGPGKSTGAGISFPHRVLLPLAAASRRRATRLCARGLSVARSGEILAVSPAGRYSQSSGA